MIPKIENLQKWLEETRRAANTRETCIWTTRFDRTDRHSVNAIWKSKYDGFCTYWPSLSPTTVRIEKRD